MSKRRDAGSKGLDRKRSQPVADKGSRALWKECHIEVLEAEDPVVLDDVHYRVGRDTTRGHSEDPEFPIPLAFLGQWLSCEARCVDEEDL